MSDESTEIEQLKAELAQRNRLVDGLQRQMAKVLDQLVEIQAELDRKSKGKKKPRDKKPAPKTERSAKAPKAPTRDQETGPKKEKEVPRRGPLADHFERTTEQHPATPQVCCSHPQVHQIADKVVEQRDYVPARVEVRRIELEQRQCQTCEALHRAPMPAVALPTGSLTGRLLAHIAYRKCGMSLPLTRIGEHLATLGLKLASSTMCNAMGHVARLLDVIYDRITARLFGGPVLLMDATGMKVLQPGETGTHRGQFVVYCNDEVSVFDYNPSKHAPHFGRFLRVGEDDAYAGKIVADSASNMTCLNTGVMKRRGGNYADTGGWQHARNNFKEARISAPAAAEEAIAWIGTFFDVEHQADAEKDDPD